MRSTCTLLFFTVTGKASLFPLDNGDLIEDAAVSGEDDSAPGEKLGGENSSPLPNTTRDVEDNLLTFDGENRNEGLPARLLAAVPKVDGVKTYCADDNEVALGDSSVI